MNIKEIFNNILSKYRKHSFDLDNPILTYRYIFNLKYTYTQYECKNCGIRLGLSADKMKNLSFKLKRGCDNTKKKVNTL